MFALLPGQLESETQRVVGPETCPACRVERALVRVEALSGSFAGTSRNYCDGCALDRTKALISCGIDVAVMPVARWAVPA